jgi:phenylpropionate dioxygenase-like ring-hydroxylating dioxygenase large terminal subunit
MTDMIDNDALRDAWHPVAGVDDVRPGPVSVRLLGEDIVLWRADDDLVVAAPDRCPHREAPLSIGSVVDGALVCCYHGWSFGCGGHCVGIPSSGPDAAIPPAAHLLEIHVAERYGLVWICLGMPSGDVPMVSHDDDPAFRRINTRVERWQVSALRMVDNFLDISHFPWVHTGTFGAGQSPLVPRIELGELDDGWFGYSYEVDANNPDQAVATTGTTEAVVHRHMSTGFQLPMMVRSTIRYEDGLEHILLLCSTPVDDTNSLFTFVVWRNDDFTVDAEDVITFDRAIGAEDKRMLEQLSGTMPLERTGLVSVQADRASVEWRRRFAELVGAGEGGDE